MNIRELFEDDNAVSPVIGVILMVAITVILAAVIATFVLGLGSQVSDTAPQVSFDFDWDSSATTGSADIQAGGAGVLTITHAGGGTLEAGNLGIVVAGTSYDADGPDSRYGSTSELTAGNEITVDADNGDKIRITWTNDQGTDSRTLRKYTVPS